MNPAACADRARALLEKAGLTNRKIGIVTGDDLLPRLDDSHGRRPRLHNLDTSEPLASCATGGERERLSRRCPDRRGSLGRAHVVITGRVADASLTLGPAVSRVWLGDGTTGIGSAAATVAGHLIECGAQATGGLWCNWQEAPAPGQRRLSDREMDEDRHFTITKPPIREEGQPGDGLRATPVRSGRPSRYLTPDVMADFTSVRLEQTATRRGWREAAQGKPATRCVQGLHCVSRRLCVERHATGGGARTRRRKASTVRGDHSRSAEASRLLLPDSRTWSAGRRRLCAGRGHGRPRAARGDAARQRPRPAQGRRWNASRRSLPRW